MRERDRMKEGTWNELIEVEEDEEELGVAEEGSIQPLKERKNNALALCSKV